METELLWAWLSHKPLRDQPIHGAI